MNCYNCNKNILAGIKCSECGVLLPITSINPFEILSLKENFDISLATIEQAVLEKMLIYHPDKYTQSTIGTQAIALKNSAIINAAATQLADTTTRVETLLKIHNINFTTNDLLITQEDLFFYMSKQETIAVLHSLEECYIAEAEYDSVVQDNYNHLKNAFDRLDLQNFLLYYTHRRFLNRWKIAINNKKKSFYETI